jgi:diguanylate cyclase (GGDEF)-like protein/PAS domain S-box-containing protein
MNKRDRLGRPKRKKAPASPRRSRAKTQGAKAKGAKTHDAKSKGVTTMGVQAEGPIAELKPRDAASFRLLFDHHPLPMWVWDHESYRFLAVNDAAVAHYGYSRQQFMAMTVLELRPVEDRDVIIRVAKERLGSRRVNRVRRHLKSDGSIIDVEVHSQTLLYRGRMASLTIAADITERKRAEEELKRTRRFLDTVIYSVPAAIMVKDAHEFRYSLINKKAENLFDLPPEQIIGRTPFELFGPDSGQTIVDQDRQAVASDGLEYAGPQLYPSQRGYETISMKKLVIRDEQGKPEHLISIVEDITEQRRSAEQLTRMARTDALSGLANRAHFAEKAKDELQRALREGGTLAVILLDLDDFKRVNDTLGHPIGDKLLSAAAARLQQAVRPTDLVARLGGDEFAILQRGQGNQREAASLLANRIRDLLTAPYDLAGHRVIVGASIGISLAPSDGSEFDQLMKCADLALYRAKAIGRNQYCFFEPVLEQRAQTRVALEADLRHALRRRQFELYYQPVVDLATREVRGAEALLRWNHPTMGIISPNDFIPIADDIGHLVDIGEWVLQKACVDASEWLPQLKVAVNLASAQFSHGDLISSVTRALAESGLPPERLELEITESTLLQNNAETIALLHQLRNIGTAVVLDDFGTGYSSLSYIKMFPYDKIKIDKSFVDEIGTRAECAAVVCAVVGLGRSLQIETTAEGVETEEQCALLRASGCNLGQGFLFSEPRPKAELPFAASLGPAPLRKASGQ